MSEFETRLASQYTSSRRSLQVGSCHIWYAGRLNSRIVGILHDASRGLDKHYDCRKLELIKKSWARQVPVCRVSRYRTRVLKTDNC